MTHPSFNQWLFSEAIYNLHTWSLDTGPGQLAPTDGPVGSIGTNVTFNRFQSIEWRMAMTPSEFSFCAVDVVDVARSAALVRYRQAT